MMNSVGAEKDPYLQAYIQARMKNHVEEIKLQKVLANLEVGRRIKKIMLNMELFEDRKTAHKLKQEASDLELKKKKAMQKQLNGSRTAELNRSGFYTFANMSKSSANTEPGRDITTAPPSGCKSAAVFPVTKGNTRAVSPYHARSHNPPFQGHVEPQTLSCQQTSAHVYHVIISINDMDKAPSARSRKHSVNTTRENSHRRRPSEQHLPQSISAHRKKSVISVTPTIHRRASAMPQLPPPAVQIDVGDVDGMKTPATVPMRQRQRATDARSVRTLPNLHTDHSLNTTRATRPKTSTLWPGDPNAIRSVRRGRKNPEEMLSPVKNGEEARRMIRDMPPTCSKNCSKPDILQELGRSYSDLPNLLPAIEKARHELARKEAAERELLEEQELTMDKEATTPMPVSQIQYMALRSMGGVRRNSVIV